MHARSKQTHNKEKTKNRKQQKEPPKNEKNRTVKNNLTNKSNVQI
jgi:hypothetical protein